MKQLFYIFQNWQKYSKPQTLSWPIGRCSHATASLDKDHIVVIGGYSTECSYCWLLSVRTKSWIEVSTTMLKISSIVEREVITSHVSTKKIDWYTCKAVRAGHENVKVTYIELA